MAVGTGLTPLVGREHEVGLLRERWAQSRDGLGQVVLLSGEAGIGKSRLVHVLTEHVMDEGAPQLTLRCSPYHTNSAFYPVIQHLQRLLQWHRHETPEARLAMLEETLLLKPSSPMGERAGVRGADESSSPPLTLALSQREGRKAGDSCCCLLPSSCCRCRSAIHPRP